MSSIIEGYNYDIFISYRQKDNKGDRWVSEFVEALKTELESTFKEDISIYFDENPHDGLLETHDVDASLKEKLKCLIFIPVISRTFCDPKAFAWQHEFLSFIEQASADKFGLKVTLPNGNVATRVLPVKIHELGPEDTQLCEEALGTALRGVDFIYKAPGVNRPLRHEEDHPIDNLNKTYYRDQINKVANALSDVINGLKYVRSETSEKETGVLKSESRRVNKFRGKIKAIIYELRLKRLLLIILSFLIILSVVYFIYKNTYLNKIENKIAVLRLQNIFNDTALIIPATEFFETINQKLTIVKTISRIPEYMTDRYDESEKSMVMIRKELKASYVLYGKIRKENQDIKISVELSATRDSKVLWNHTYTWRNELISNTSREIIRVIANMMEIKLTPEEQKQLDTEASVNPSINLNYISANSKLKDAWSYYNYGDKVLDSSSFIYAIESYDKIIKEDTLFALAYAKRAIARSWGLFLGELDSSNIKKCKIDIDKALSINSDLPEIEIAQGFYYYYCKEQNEPALEHFEKAAVKDPGNYQPIFYMALVNRRLGNWDICQKLIHRVIKSTPQEALFLTNIGMIYSFFHKFDSALIYNQLSIDQIPGWVDSYKNKFEVLILKDGITSEARTLIDAAIKRTGENMNRCEILLKMYDKKYRDALLIAEKASQDDFNFPAEKYLLLAKISRALNNQKDAQRYSESARLILNQSINKRPDDPESHAAIGLAYAGLGEKAKAIEEGEKAIQIAALKNKMDESDMKIYLAQILTMVGDFDDASPRIINLLNTPSFFSKKLMELDPVWKPLLDKPEYRKRIKKNNDN